MTRKVWPKNKIKFRNKIKFKNRIKKYRLRMGLTRKELSNMTGFSERYIYSLEYTGSFPRPPARKILLDKLKLTFDELYEEVNYGD